MKAVVSGQLAGGNRFPSIRSLSQELRVNPNTAQKAVSRLIEEGVLIAKPGVGTEVSLEWVPRKEEVVNLVRPLIRDLVGDAGRLSLQLEEVEKAVRDEWACADRE